MFKSKRFENTMDRAGAAGRNALLWGGAGAIGGPATAFILACVGGAQGWIRNKPIGYALDSAKVDYNYRKQVATGSELSPRQTAIAGFFEAIIRSKEGNDRNINFLKERLAEKSKK